MLALFESEHVLRRVRDHPDIELGRARGTCRREPRGRGLTVSDDVDDAVVLLRADAAVIGSMDKLAAHQRATRHLAFSVVLFASDGRVLLQRRAASKYHFAGRWSNTCCSHPRPGEPLRAAGRRRTREELGFDPGPLEVRGAFWYEARDPASGLVEHEYDVVLVGGVDTAALDRDRFDRADIEATALNALDAVRAACAESPRDFTPWLPDVLDIATGRPRPIAVDVPY
ncbi:MAG TPA: isopentenyl-diphosphate Delta-isomerase [Euzebyales bacterium]|nr:isopentenyl-diphosphate Delta-isomerase [Euzebyales bacterium]